MYIPLDFQVSERLHQSSEFSRIYLIDYSSLPNNRKKVNCYGEVIKFGVLLISEVHHTVANVAELGYQGSIS